MALAPVKELDTSQMQESVDWSKIGAIKPPAQQGACGSCWAITAASAFEAAHFIKTGELIEIST